MPMIVGEKICENLEIFQFIQDSTGTRVRCHTGSDILVGLDINNYIENLFTTL